MKKLLIVLALCVFAVSCCEVDHNNSQEKKPTKITATSFKVYKESGAFVWNIMNSCIMDISISQTMEKSFYFILLNVLVSINLWRIKVYEYLQYLL